MIALTWTYGQLLRGLAEMVRRVLVVQVLFLAPCFWLLELSQTVAFQWMNGDWGWGYVGMWGGVAVGMWAFHHYGFRPLRVASWRRVLWATLLCWTGLWLGGFVATEVFQPPHQTWPGTRWVYVGLSALFCWAATALLYRLAAPETEQAAAEPTPPSAPPATPAADFTRAKRAAGA